MQRHPLSCFFDGCSAHFDHADRLSEHLILAHNMLYKDVETRNKMNLMFLEQIKHQMTEQYVMSSLMNGGGTGSGGGGGGVNAPSHAQPFETFAGADQQQQHQQQQQQNIKLEENQHVNTDGHQELHVLSRQI